MFNSESNHFYHYFGHGCLSFESAIINYNYSNDNHKNEYDYKFDINEYNNNYTYQALNFMNFTTISLYAHLAGYNATIFCNYLINCTINCHCNSWNRLTIDNYNNNCDGGYGSNVFVTCDYRKENELCPNGLWHDSSIQLNDNNLKNIDLINYRINNSLYSDICNIHGRLCDETDEGAEKEINHFNEGLCCVAEEACLKATAEMNITDGHAHVG